MHRLNPAVHTGWEILLITFGLLPVSMAAAQTQVDTSRWECEYCPTVKGWEGQVTAGVGNVSDDSFKFGDFTGLQEQGLFPILEGQLLYRDDTGYYTELYVDDLGLASRSVNLEGGRQGRYVYRFVYDNLPHYIDDTTRTPFTGNTVLQLHTGWVPAGSTAGMSGLPAALRNVDLFRERETVALGFGFIQSGTWEYTADYQRQARSGVDAVGGSFLNTTSLLPMPIDYVTDQVDLGAAFSADKLQIKVAYYGSFFTNKNDTLTWENPFTPLTPDADMGQLALPPDNDFHQVSVSAAYRLGAVTRLNAAVAAGEMTQNETFPAATLNAGLGPVPLPRGSLSGEVDTLNYHVRLTTRPLQRLDIRFEHRYSERDNNTPIEVYQQVDADIFLSGLRANVPYSFERATTEASAAYRLPGDIKLAAGVERDTHERTFQDVADTEQDSRWGEVSAYLWGLLDLRFKLAHESRDASAYDPFGDVATQENPAMRKFNMADRERDLGRAYIAVSPLTWLSIGLTADVTEDEYNDSQIGLTDAEQNSYALDVSITPVQHINLYLFGARDEIQSHMAGSSSFSSPDWFARQRDTVHTVTSGVELDQLFKNISLGLNYTHSRSRGEIAQLPVPAIPFPDLRTRLNSAGLYVKYALKERLVLRFDYYKERYRTEDWALDGVDVDTVPALLALGQMSPDYNVTVLGTALEYRF